MEVTNIKLKRNSSVILKVVFILIMIALLMIPNFMIQGLIYERSGRKAEIESEIAKSYGQSQKVMAPILRVPYTKTTKYKNGETSVAKGDFSFSSNETKIDGNITPSLRRRSIYDIVVYDAALQIESELNISQPDNNLFPSLELDYSQAYMIIGLADPNGLTDESTMLVNGKAVEFDGVSTYKNHSLHFVKTKSFAVTPESALAINIDLRLKGTKSLTIEPSGEKTTVDLQSPWPDPSFVGTKLPNSRDITEKGFTSKWNINKYAHNYPKQWINDHESLNQNFEFGVKLLQPIDEYGKNSRTAKYALLIIVLCFAIFFFFEILFKKQIHPIQYTMIGFALTIFFLLLLSITEHLGFDKAYLISSIATVGLIVVYTNFILVTKKATVTLAFLLTGLFSYIFIILQMEDFALLAGALALFVVLAAVMFLSRKVDWYNLSNKEIE